MASTSTKRSAPSSPPSDSRSPKNPRHESGLVDLGLSPHRIEELDKKVLLLAGDSPHPATLLSLVVGTADDVESLDMKFAIVKKCEELLKGNDELVDQLKQAWTQHKFTPIRSLKVLQSTSTRSTVEIVQSSSHPQVSEEEQMKATIDSWEAKYESGANKAFISTINKYIENSHHKYAHHIAVVQSSGTGKSRMLREVTREIFGVIMNFRRDSMEGYPKADRRVRDYLLNPESPSGVENNAYFFFTALFDHLSSMATTLRTPADLMDHIGYGDRKVEQREEFYETVVNMAKEMRMAETPMVKEGRHTPEATVVLPHGETRTLDQAATQLYDEVLKKHETTHQVKFVLGFDEVSEMTASHNGNWNAFTIIRRVLRGLRHHPIFSVFMSTTGTVRQFHPSLTHDLSTRIERGILTLWPPFTLLDYDPLAIKLKATDTLEDVTKPLFMLSLGRPLFKTRYECGNHEVRDSIIRFARTKLTAGKDSNARSIAPLAVRLPLTFNSLTTEGIEAEQCQVESHMRVCVRIDPDANAMFTVAPSEPALVEAAAQLMYENGTRDSPLTTLSYFLSNRYLSKGDRGELACMFLLLLAHDEASRAIGLRDRIRLLPYHTPLLLTKFLSTLFATKHQNTVLGAYPSTAGETLEKTFENSWVHFTHFIKVMDYDVVHRDFLRRVMARGAAILCADNQLGIDAIIPVCYKGKSLISQNMTAILIQSKNVKHLNNTRSFLFGNMDPTYVGVFKTTEVTLPVIKLVMSFGTTSASVTCPSVSTTMALRERTERPLVYEIFASALSSDTFGPVLKKEEVTWQTLVARSRIEDLYPSSPQDAVVGVIQHMTPCVDSKAGHWEKFVES